MPKNSGTGLHALMGLFLLAVSFTAVSISLPSQSLAAEMALAPSDYGPYRLIAVRNVELERMTGCGVRPPDGQPCAPDRTEARFIVKSGGSCHRYLAQVTNRGGTPTLAIWDSEMRDCTRPEQQEYAASATISANVSRLSGVILRNPLYIQVVYRP